jgi:menaquinol-cytochrome c reductase iron-sulfur subunit
VADDTPEIVTRRRFLNRLSLGLSAAAGAVLSVPIIAYLLSPLINAQKPQWITLGSVDTFQIGQTVEVSFDDPSPLPWAGETAKTAVWLRRTGSQDFTVFAVNCTHLGCPVNWLADANLFLCPCHGGIFYSDGTVGGGPPPRALFNYDTRVQGNTVQVLTRPLPVASP